MCKITIAQPMQSADVIPSSCKICGMADCNSMQATKILRSAIGCSGSYGIGQLQHHGRGIWDIRPRISTVKAIQRSVLQGNFSCYHLNQDLKLEFRLSHCKSHFGARIPRQTHSLNPSTIPSNSTIPASTSGCIRFNSNLCIPLYLINLDVELKITEKSGHFWWPMILLQVMFPIRRPTEVYPGSQVHKFE